MKTVLCYGDSNSWGYDPTSKERFAPETRWTGVLAESLGVAFRVIEEGLNGRTTVWDDPIEGHKNGQTYLVPCLASHKPIDLVVLNVGDQRSEDEVFGTGRRHCARCRSVMRHHPEERYETG